MKKFSEPNLSMRMVNKKRVVIAFIPVRGGSKGIPQKNIKLFCGKPLVYWTIKAACECDLVDRVYVATDCDRIKQTVQEFRFDKIILVERSLESSSDTASTESVMLEFARQYNFDDIVLIQATSPLLESIDLSRGLNKYQHGMYDSLLSVVRQKRFLWQDNKCNDSVPVNYVPDKRPRRQDMEGFLVENGAFYITKREALLRSECRLSGKVGTYVMQEDTYFEIDEIHDWNISEKLKWSRIANQNNKTRLKDINLFVCDIDGVLTDSGMYYNHLTNDELKKFNTKDGKGIELLRKAGIQVMFLTSEDTHIVKRRAEKLQIEHCFIGINNKKKKLDEFFMEHPYFSYKKTAYIGDDLNDLEVVQNVGFSGAPQDAVCEIKQIVNYICEKSGGQGCVREFSDLIRRFKCDE